MDSTLLISTGGAIVAAAVGSLTTSAYLSGRSERENAKQLLAQAQRGLSGLQTEVESFYERSASKRARWTALAHLALGILSAWREDGKWMSATARELQRVRDWDLSEGDRFMDRFSPAISELSTAVVLLCLLDQEIREAALRLANNLTPFTSAKNADARRKASEVLGGDLANLSMAVQHYLRKRWWRREPRPARSK